jgi:hypothetical protein
MNTADYSGKAAAIVDDIIRRSDGDLGPEDRDPFRVIVRIAFEVQEFLATKSSDVDALDWTQDTVLSGCDSIHLARSAWSLLRLAGALDEDGKSRPSKTNVQPYTFPADLNDIRERLDDALRSVQDDSLSWTERVRAVSQAARLQLVFLGATLS